MQLSPKRKRREPHSSPSMRPEDPGQHSLVGPTTVPSMSMSTLASRSTQSTLTVCAAVPGHNPLLCILL